MKKLYCISLLLCLFFVSKIAIGQIWTQKANFADSTNGAVGFSIGAKGYILSGDTSHSFYEWDQATNTWTRKADFPSTGTGTGGVGFSIGTKGYIVTGDIGQEFWEWNQATNIWTQKANFEGASRDAAVGFSIGNKGYVGTGGGHSSNLNDFWEWNQSTNTWTQKADFGGTARFSAIGFSIGTKGYIGTGNDGMLPNPVQSDLWEWDGDIASPTYNTWTQKANCGGGITQSAVAFSIGTLGFICRGMTHDFWEWDQSTNTWSPKTNFGGVVRYYAVGFSIGNKGYIGTGQDYNNNLLRDFWEYSDTTVGVNEITYLQNMAVYPNPANDKIYIERSNNNAMEVNLFDLLGNKVFTIMTSKNKNTEIDVSGINKGVYILKITINNNSLNKKVVIE